MLKLYFKSLVFVFCLLFLLCIAPILEQPEEELKGRALQNFSLAEVGPLPVLHFQAPVFSKTEEAPVVLPANPEPMSFEDQLDDIAEKLDIIQQQVNELVTQAKANEPQKLEEDKEEAIIETPKEKSENFMTIRELNAKGFRNLVVQPSNSQDSKGKGYWENGKWKVMVTRPLVTSDKKVDIQFETGKLIPYALAVWDGSNKEIGGQKSITSWYYLSLEMPTPKSVYFYVIIAIIMAVSIQFWVIGRIRRFPPEIPAEEV